MSEIAFEVLIIVGLIFVNGVFALAEMSIVGSRKSRLQRLADKGNQRAKAALKIAESPGDFLSTVQIGITLVGILSGAFAGATIAEQLASRLAFFPAMAPYAETTAIAIVVVAITYLSLIIGELVPKRIALNNPERIGSIMARPMRLLSRLMLPAVRMLSISTDVVLWLLRVKPSGEPTITEDEVRILLRQGTVAGGFDKAKQEMIERVFRFGSLRLPSIMTPRRDVIVLYSTDTIEAITEKVKAGGHSHYPLCEANLDNVMGIVSTKDLLLGCLAEGRFDLRSCAREVLSIPETASPLKALELLKRSESQVILVIDEFGGFQGIATMNDLARAIIGLFPEVEIPRIVPREDGSLVVEGSLPVHELWEAIRLPQLSVDDSHKYSTVGGFVLDRLGRIPATGEAFNFGDYRIEVLEMDGLRVNKVIVVRNNPLPS
jgi:putative hemolysin